jgi:hypothetical protein
VALIDSDAAFTIRQEDSMRLRSLLVLVAIVSAFHLAACSKQSSTPPRGSEATVTIVANDSGFVLPDTMRAGLNQFVYENSGSIPHECEFIRLPDGMSGAEYIAQVKSGVPFPAGAVDCGGLGLMSPGERVEQWAPLEEGNYMATCWLDLHFTRCKPQTFVVHGMPARPIEPPKEDVTVRLIDFRFELVGEIKHGEQTLRYETVGPSMHEADIIRLDEGRTIEDARKFFDKEIPPAPGVLGGGLMDSHDLKRVSWVRRTFKPGHYLFWCDMPMIQTSAPKDTTVKEVTHADAGMFKEVTID